MEDCLAAICGLCGRVGNNMNKVNLLIKEFKLNYAGEVALFTHDGQEGQLWGKTDPRDRIELWKPTGRRYDLVIGVVPGGHGKFDRAVEAVMESCHYYLHIGVPPSGDYAGRIVLRHRLAFGEDMIDITVYMGDLTGELIRIDDYPTGVRPLVADRDKIHEILLKFEQLETDYRLGIVPAILDEDMKLFLSGLRYMRPVLHGYDHGYPHFSKYLVERGDPYNQRGTVGGFDEFEHDNSSVIFEKLQKGKKLLEEITGLQVNEYIPPCNRAGFRTGRILEELGLRRYFSEKRIPRCRLERIGSDFYGRTSDFPMGGQARVITLHVTWEYDLIRKGDSSSLVNFLYYLRRCRKRRRDLAERVFADLVRVIEAGLVPECC
ncbi:hypothetical protein DGMP_08110 [Desulfomarina profundi]|uniref:Uncharacterized protein n=2 Tax=Desulfomarina profundi TaxID=2772557 RepID=A0A8D5FF16_9BACT|nr:hypothetical protein DGMP_08110 [Desulfomarina profundi]